MSKETVRRSTFTKESVHGKMKKMPADSQEEEKVTYHMEMDTKNRKLSWSLFFHLRPERTILITLVHPSSNPLEPTIRHISTAPLENTRFWLPAKSDAQSELPHAGKGGWKIKQPCEGLRGRSQHLDGWGVWDIKALSDIAKSSTTCLQV